MKLVVHAQQAGRDTNGEGVWEDGSRAPTVVSWSTFIHFLSKAITKRQLSRVVLRGVDS